MPRRRPPARDICLELYRRAAARCADAGFVLADTKFELGYVDGVLCLCDEVCTPDSSRLWPADQVVPGQTPPAFDKQPLRDWLAAQPWDRTPPPPPLPDEVTAAMSARYVAAYERVTGRSLGDWYGATGMRFRARVEVQLRPGIADPEGATIERALPALGFDSVAHVRAGRSFSFEVDAADEGAARTTATELADRLLANPVIEQSRLELEARGLSGAAHRRRRLPGHQLRARRGPGRRGGWGTRACCSGTATPGSAASTPWCCPAASPTATTCAPAPWPASRPSWRR